jgi:hypothetical protein
MIRKKLTVSLLFALLFVESSAVEGQKIETTTVQSGKFQLRISDGFLFLVANKAPLAQIFGEIGKQAKIAVDTIIGPEETMTISLDGVPLETGIKQLAKNVSIFYAEDPHNKTHRIARVVVLSDGKEGTFGRSQASSKPGNLNESPPQPEPFKFEFDPRKFAEKQKSSKQP